MPMLKDIWIWRAIWTPAIRNIRMQGICSVQEASSTVHTEPINQTDAAILTAVHLSFVRTAAVNVWVATLSLAVKVKKWQKENKVLISG